LDLPANLKEYLKEQFKNARIVLMSGAGFSYDAKDKKGRKLPVGSALAREIWDLAFHGEPFDEESSLQDLYQHANTRHRKALTELMHDA
jgi:hypothetical protein